MFGYDPAVIVGLAFAGGAVLGALVMGLYLQSERAALRERAARAAALQEDAVAAREALAESKAQLASAHTELRSERVAAAEKLQLLEQARTSMSLQFERLAHDIFEEKRRAFARENQTQLDQVLEPLRMRLGDFKAQVERFYAEEGDKRTRLSEQVHQLAQLNQTLSQQAQGLASALRGSHQSQGAWGEMVLERLLESAGLQRDRHFRVQATYVGPDGRRSRPDVVVHLPEGRDLIIDSKVSLTDYEAFCQANLEEERAAHLGRHVDALRSHVRGLSGKRYQDIAELRTLDFVVLFVPIEPAFLVATGQDPKLFDEAWSRNVLLVSPSSLIFVLRTVAHLWRQEDQGRNAEAIAQQGARLYEKLCTFVESLEEVGDRLRQAREAYDAAHGQLTSGRGNAIRQAEKLRALGVGVTRELPADVVSIADER